MTVKSKKMLLELEAASNITRVLESLHFFRFSRLKKVIESVPNSLQTAGVWFCDILYLSMVLSVFDNHTSRVKPKLLNVGPRGSAVERQSLASVLSPSYGRPVADG